MSRLIRRLSNASISSITSIGTPTNGLPGVVGSVGPMDVPADADPQACFEVFCSHWAQVKGIMVKQNASSGNRFPRSKASFDDIQAVANYATQMMYLLVEETQPTEGVLGHMLELTIGENVMDRLLSWGLACGEHSEDMKREILRIYEMMLSQSKQGVLMHNALLNPLLRLLIACSEYCSDRVELHLVLLLHQLCVSLSKDPVLLEYLFHASPNQGPAKFLLFSLLIPFLHRDGKVGQQARDALLLCISVSSQGENIARYITESTNLCPVLATGLGALYSRLPRVLDIKVDHWHCLTREDWTVMPDLCMFLHSLEFCNAVVQVAHPLVANQLVQYFHDGFLVPVIGPALHQFSADGDVNDLENPAPQDEIVATTAYVNLFVSSITTPALMKAFLHYLCMGQHEGRLVLDSLLTRIGTNSRLCLVTLSLFHTLVNLNCEDFMLEIILKFLVPCNHLMVSQRKAIKDVDLHSKSADRFLSLRPACCQTKTKDSSPSQTVASHQTINAITNGMGDSPKTEHQVMLHLPHSRSVPSGPRNSFNGHHVTKDQGAVHKQTQPGQQNLQSNSQAMDKSLSDFETSQVEYLLDAKSGIKNCTSGTLHWSAPYDGLSPPPAILSPDNMSPSDDRGRTPSLSFDTTSNAPSSAAYAVLAADEDQSLGSSYKSYSLAELLPRNRERQRSVDPKLTASIQEVLSLSIGSGNERVDTSDVNITDLFSDEKAAIAQNQTADYSTSSPPSKDKQSLETLTETQPIEKSISNQIESPAPAECPRNKSDQPEKTKELTISESRVGTGKSRPKDLHLPGSGVKHSQESDSAFSGSNSPVLDYSNHNGISSAGGRVDPINSSIASAQKGSQVANWLQALGEDASGASFIETLSDNKKEKRMSLVKQESERDADEPCVFWEFDSDIEFSPKGSAIKQNSVGAEGLMNEASQILSALGFDNLQNGTSSSSNIASKPQSVRRRLESDVSEVDELSSSLNENYFSVFRSSSTSDPNRTHGFSDNSLNSSGASYSMVSPSNSPQSTLQLMQGPASKPAYSPIGRVIGMPTTGPFMDAIFTRLDTMMQNSFYVNLLLTGIIARLACYPQSLLRSYLLNTSMVFQPSVRSLIQVLTSIKNKLDAYSASIPEFETLLVRAKEYLYIREDGDSVYRGRSIGEMSEAANAGRQRSGSVKSLAKHKSTLDRFLNRGSRRNKSISNAEKQKLARINEGGMALPAASAEYQSLKTRNAVYCAVIFDEFLKELAAISQEHAVAFSEQELGLR